MPGTIEITVRLFASMRDAAGTDRLSLTLAAGTPAGAVWGHLPEDVAPPRPPGGLRYAINDEWTVPGATLADGDEVSLIPPVVLSTWVVGLAVVPP